MNEPAEAVGELGAATSDLAYTLAVTTGTWYVRRALETAGRKLASASLPVPAARPGGTCTGAAHWCDGGAAHEGCGCCWWPSTTARTSPCGDPLRGSASCPRLCAG
ncbi:DUF5133 domain-containing protein [Streptomyces sp. MC1]|uniref:DUF5133 domain-containing protein n=1 Tax=Streptomyces sp. MC1 TaxID=295105 RepID=UPI0035A85BFC